VLLAFVDESYNRNLFCLTALIAEEGAVISVTEALETILRSVTDHGYRTIREFHGHEMLQAVGGWKGVPIRLRMNAYLQAVQAIRASGSRSIFVAVEWGDDRGDPTPPHEVALHRLLELLQRYAEEVQDHILVLADEVHSAERHRTNFRFYQDEHSDQRLDRILDTLYFGPSHHSRLLQAADLLCYMRLRLLTVVETDPRAQVVNNAIWEQINTTMITTDEPSIGKHKGSDQKTGA